MNSFTEFEIHLPPSGNHRNGFNRKTGKYYPTAKYTKYIADLALIKRALKIEKVMGETEVHLHIYKESKRKFDIDNIMKSLFDSMTKAGIIEDDALIKSGAFSFDEDIVKGGWVRVRIRAHERREPFWSWVK